jgi:uncharacterized protein YwgA
MVDTREIAVAAAKLVGDAGGEVVGKTRIQKAAYFLEKMGLGHGFDFYYKHYGPYSDELSNALHYARELGLTVEENKRAAWGGLYTIFRNAEEIAVSDNDVRKRVLGIARQANPVALELAATALFLKCEGEDSPWAEVRNLKPTKASRDNVTLAKKLYEEFQAIPTPQTLPALQ